MKKLSALLIFLVAGVNAQTTPRNPSGVTGGNPVISVGSSAPDPSFCSADSIGAIFVRSQNPANGPIDVLRCTQSGALTYSWLPISHVVSATMPATCSVGDIGFRTGVTAGQNIYVCSSANTWTVVGAPQTITRALGFTFDGGGAALSAGATAYIRVPYACTIIDWSISSTTAETVTVKTWKIATGTALPTVSNSISTSGVSLSTGTHVRSTTLTDFTTTTVAANDVIAANITAVTASQMVNFTLGCQ